MRAGICSEAPCAPVRLPVSKQGSQNLGITCESVKPGQPIVSDYIRSIENCRSEKLTIIIDKPDVFPLEFRLRNRLVQLGPKMALKLLRQQAAILLFQSILAPLIGDVCEVATEIDSERIGCAADTAS